MASTSSELIDRLQINHRGLSQDYVNCFVGAQSALALWLDDLSNRSGYHLERFKSHLQSFSSYEDHLERKVKETLGEPLQETIHSLLSRADPKTVHELDAIANTFRRLGADFDPSDRRSILETVGVFWTGFRLAALLIHGSELFGNQFADRLRDLRLQSEQGILTRQAA